MSSMKAVIVDPARMYRTGSAPNRRSLNKSGKGKGTTFNVTLVLQERWRDEHGLLNLQGSGTNIGIQAQRLYRGSCRSILSGQHGACGQEKCRYGACQKRPGRAPFGVRSRAPGLYAVSVRREPLFR